MFQCEIATHYISNLDNFEMLWHGCRTVWHPTFGSVACGWNCSFEWNCWYCCKWANTRAHESTWNWFCTIITINLYVDMYRFQCALDETPCFSVATHYISVADVLLASGLPPPRRHVLRWRRRICENRAARLCCSSGSLGGSRLLYTSLGPAPAGHSLPPCRFWGRRRW